MSSPNDFKLERLKHILKQQDFLNESFHKYLTFFQTVTTAIITGIVAIFISWQKLGVSIDITKVAIRTLEFLLVIMGLFIVFVMISSIFSWWDYRKEEKKIFDMEVSTEFRNAPSVRGIWRWFETWFLVLIIILCAVFVTLIESFIIPAIK